MNERGLTLIEMIAVLLLISIVSAVVINRFLNITTVGEIATKETVKTHIRYAQAMAMKQNRFTWGIKCDSTQYWLFRTDNPSDAAEPDNHPTILPGEEDEKLSSAGMSLFTVYFDKFGKPLAYSALEGKPIPITAVMTISIGADSIRISPETGFVS